MYSVRLKHHSPMNIINSRRSQLEDLKLSLERSIGGALAQAKNRLSLSCARLEALSPLARLSGGYSYVAGADGAAVTSIQGVNVGDVLDINVSDGIIKSKVLEISRAAREISERGE